jgi:hypothetical protein
MQEDKYVVKNKDCVHFAHSISGRLGIRGR